MCFLPKLSHIIGRKIITYETNRSDTLQSIALKFNMSTNEVMRLNKLRTSSIFPGQVCLRCSSVAQAILAGKPDRQPSMKLCSQLFRFLRHSETSLLPSLRFQPVFSPVLSCYFTSIHLFTNLDKSGSKGSNLYLFGLPFHRRAFVLC